MRPLRGLVFALLLVFAWSSLGLRTLEASRPHDVSAGAPAAPSAGFADTSGDPLHERLSALPSAMVVGAGSAWQHSGFHAQLAIAAVATPGPVASVASARGVSDLSLPHAPPHFLTLSLRI